MGTNPDVSSVVEVDVTTHGRLPGVDRYARDKIGVLAPRLTLKRAAERLGFLGLPFLFFIEVAEGRAFVLYRRYDGHYGLISPAG
jgi:Sigma 54 modulation/S30EA ribosomal protein C terminus